MDRKQLLQADKILYQQITAHILIILETLNTSPRKLEWQILVGCLAMIQSSFYSCYQNINILSEGQDAQLQLFSQPLLSL